MDTRVEVTRSVGGPHIRQSLLWSQTSFTRGSKQYNITGRGKWHRSSAFCTYRVCRDRHDVYRRMDLRERRHVLAAIHGISIGQAAIYTYRKLFIKWWQSFDNVDCERYGWSIGLHAGRDHMWTGLRQQPVMSKCTTYSDQTATSTEAFIARRS